MFPTTHWSLLARASLDGDSGGREALEELCRRYWTPLNEYIRSRGHDETEAADLTQDFIVHVLERSMLNRADRLRGRFRSFLLGSLVRFLHDKRDWQVAQKRGAGAVHVSFDDVEADLSIPGSGVTGFDRDWALAILERALHVVEGHGADNGRAFVTLRGFLPGAVPGLSYDEAAAQLGLSLPALKSEVHRLRRRFKEAVRQEVANTVSAPHEVDEEIEHLQRVLMDRGSDLNVGTNLLPQDS